MREKYFSTPPLRGGVRNSWFWRHRPAAMMGWPCLCIQFGTQRWKLGSAALWWCMDSPFLLEKFSNFLLRPEKRPSLAPTKYRKNVRHVKGVYDASLVSRGLSMTSKLDLFVNLIIFTLFESISFSLLFSEMLSCQVTRKWFSTKLRKSFSHFECKNKGWCCALA